MKIWWKPKERAYPDPENIAESKIASLQDGITDFDGLHVYNRLRVPVGVDMYVVETPPDIIESTSSLTCWMANAHAQGDPTWYGAWSDPQGPAYDTYPGNTVISTRAAWVTWGLGKNGYTINRAKLHFVSTGITVTVLQAEVDMYLNAINQNLGNSAGIHIVSGIDLTDASTPVTDYGALRAYDTPFASLDGADMVVGAYNKLTLNQSGVDFINYMVGEGRPIFLGVRPYLDLENTSPTDGSIEHQEQWAGSTDIFSRYPKLMLRYA